jgi:hypothetical protein
VTTEMAPAHSPGAWAEMDSRLRYPGELVARAGLKQRLMVRCPSPRALRSRRPERRCYRLLPERSVVSKRRLALQEQTAAGLWNRPGPGAALESSTNPQACSAVRASREVPPAADPEARLHSRVPMWQASRSSRSPAAAWSAERKHLRERQDLVAVWRKSLKKMALPARPRSVAAQILRVVAAVVLQLPTHYPRLQQAWPGRSPTALERPAG